MTPTSACPRLFPVFEKPGITREKTQARTVRNKSRCDLASGRIDQKEGIPCPEPCRTGRFAWWAAAAESDAALKEGARVIATSRNRAVLQKGYRQTGVTVAKVDLTDEGSIKAQAAEVGGVDHVVAAASARARGAVAELESDAILRSFHTKVGGLILPAKHFAPTMPPGGSFVLLSGVAALEPDPGFLAVAANNGAVNTVVRFLAVEPAPINTNAVSPGTIDTGTWDALGEQSKADLFARLSAANPAGRIGAPEDVAPRGPLRTDEHFRTGACLDVDGGQPLVCPLTTPASDRGLPARAQPCAEPVLPRGPDGDRGSALPQPQPVSAQLPATTKPRGGSPPACGAHPAAPTRRQYRGTTLREHTGVQQPTQ
ncbi:SDR family oxidoreductase [Streptomyces cynarae]|uniref:SDR family oxidoreductase n=1 Tax=Streptomyces cynarae TaxID=2981134 RepID=UPI00406D497C